jgi:hypothetical protein
MNLVTAFRIWDLGSSYPRLVKSWCGDFPMSKSFGVRYSAPW